MVIGAAVLLFIASLLDFYSADGVDLPSVWDTDVYHLALPTVFLTAFVAAGLLVGSRFLPQGRGLAGVPLPAWGTVLAVSSVWAALWSLITCPSTFDLGAGAVISFLATLAIAGVAIAGPKIPALAGQLIPDPAPAAPAAAFGSQPQPGSGYGYPGGQQPQPYGATPSRSRRTAASPPPTSRPRLRPPPPTRRPRPTSPPSGSRSRWPAPSSPRTAPPARSPSSPRAPGTWPWNSAASPR